MALLFWVPSGLDSSLWYAEVAKRTSSCPRGLDSLGGLRQSTPPAPTANCSSQPPSIVAAEVSGAGSVGLLSGSLILITIVIDTPLFGIYSYCGYLNGVPVQQPSLGSPSSVGSNLTKVPS